MKLLSSIKSLNQFAVLALCSSFLLFSGCKKKDITYTISGVINDNAYSTTLEGATVTIKAVGSQTDDFTKVFTTGSDGAYSLTFKRANYTSITISVEKGGYFPITNTYSIDDFKVNETTAKSYTVDAKAWVRIHFTGDGSKTVKYFKQQGYNGCEECCPTGDQYVYNVLDNEVLCINKGNALYQIYYFVQGGTQQGQVDVVTVPFEYTELLVHIN